MLNGHSIRDVAGQAISRPFLYAPLQAGAGRLFGGFVLAFHDLPGARFREIIDALRPNEPVPLSVMVDRIRNHKSTYGTFAITFDDGVGDTVRGASAVAIERHWPVTFYIPTDYLDCAGGMPFQWLRAVTPRLPAGSFNVGSTHIDASTADARAEFQESIVRLMWTHRAEDYVPLIRALLDRALHEGWAQPSDLAPPAPVSWEEVAALARHPEMQFESHGVSHTAVSALFGADLEHELRESRNRIAEHTNRPCRHFCYPFGGMESIGHRAAASVRRFYESAVTMTRGRVNGCNVFLLPRIPVYERDTSSIARLKILTP